MSSKFRFAGVEGGDGGAGSKDKAIPPPTVVVKSATELRSGISSVTVKVGIPRKLIFIT